MKEMHEFARPQLAKFLAACDARTMALLQPAMEKALDIVEEMSPAALVPMRDGVARVYGPRTDGYAFNMIVASPEAAMVVGWDEWGRIPSELPHHNPATLWKTIYELLKKGNGNAVVTALMVRVGTKGVATMRRAIGKAKKVDLTGIIVVLCAAADEQACGLTGVIILPMSFEQQLARVEARD